MIYVGFVHANHRVVFKCETTPSKQSHPLYGAVMGPFRTMRGAKWAASPGAISNPHFRHVNDAERIAKELAR